jgi:hypothetical protein
MDYFGVNEGAHAELITAALGIALILTSSALLLKGFIAEAIKARKGHPIVNALYHVREENNHKVLITILFGAFLGVMVTVSSVGAGALGAVVLLFLYPKMTGSQIVATDIAHAVPLTALAGFGHASVGTVDWNLLMHLVLGSLPGIYLGSKVGIRIPDKVMRMILAVILLLVGIKCLL